jgi:hypothetical protein
MTDNELIKMVTNAYEDGKRMFDDKTAIANVIRVIADELGYRIFMPGNDVNVVETKELYKLADEMEKNK